MGDGTVTDRAAAPTPAPVGIPADADGPAASHVVRHAYVHVPFCPTICPFCSFDVLERRAGAVEAYLDGLDAELATTLDRLEVGPMRTIYLGGGTPSYLRDAEVERLVGILRSRLGWAPEVTLEVHPATVTPERLRRWVDAGTTRLSVGVQSFDDAVLRRLGRTHDGATNRRVVEAALATGAIVSVDLITAVEGQDVVADLRTAAATGVHHVSAYTLTIEPGTPFAAAGVEPHEERAALEAAAAVLGAAGIRRYEVSNHARGGAECAHNLAYWDGAWWLGVGPGASSHEPVDAHADDATVALRRTNPSLGAWLAGDPPAEVDRRDASGWALDAVLSGLRRVAGVDLAAVGRRSSTDTRSRWTDQIDELTTRGWLDRDGDVIRATPEGLVHLDAVMAAFV